MNGRWKRNFDQSRCFKGVYHTLPMYFHKVNICRWNIWSDVDDL